MRCLVFVGGWAHPAELTGPPTAAALSALGHDVEIVDTFSAVVDRVRVGTIDLIVVHTCRFQMLDARYTPSQRAAYASVTPQALRDAVDAHVAAGRPVLAMHAAALSFDDWPAWTEIAGATWSWDRSNHPPPGPFEVVVTDDLVVAGPQVGRLANFQVVDELYRFVTPAAAALVLATAADDQGIVHPIAWVHHSGRARVAYSALGHDQRSLANPGHRALLGAIVDWLGDA